MWGSIKKLSLNNRKINSFQSYIVKQKLPINNSKKNDIFPNDKLNKQFTSSMNE